MENLLLLTDKNFKKEILESGMPLLVDFWASWCPPCKMVEPTLQELAQNLNATIKIAKINVDQNPISASECQISGVPTFIVFKNGKEIARRVGAQSKQQLLNTLKGVGIKEQGLSITD